MAQDGPSAHPATLPRHRPLIAVLAGFALGIALDNALGPDAWCWIALALAGAALALWGARRGLHEWGHWLLAILLMAALGGFWHDVRFRQALLEAADDLQTVPRDRTEASHHQVGTAGAADSERLVQGGRHAHQRCARLTAQELDEEASVKGVALQNQDFHRHDRRRTVRHCHSLQF